PGVHRANADWNRIGSERKSSFPAAPPPVRVAGKTRRPDRGPIGLTQKQTRIGIATRVQCGTPARRPASTALVNAPLRPFAYLVPPRPYRQSFAPLRSGIFVQFLRSPFA